MDEELSQFEAELRGLRPAAPPSRMLAHLERELAVSPRRAPLEWWIWAGTLPVAAALAVMITLAVKQVGVRAAKPTTGADAAKATPPGLASFKPVAAENVLYAAEDEGLITLADGTPARRERLSYVDTITWTNTRTNASVRWSVPREEVRVVPVNFQ
jgi:hypothetical protein